MFVVDAGQIILAKPADRLGGPQYSLANPLLVERHERPIAFLHLDNAVLDRHDLLFPSLRTITQRRPARQ